MESPVVVDKPPEYHGRDDRGFPFDEDEGSRAWSELAARHPDIAARLRQHPAAAARKRRVSPHATDDFGDSFGGFDRFPFDDIPAEFREHFPSHWNRRFSAQEPHQQPQQPPAPQSPSQQTTATQTEHNPPTTSSQPQQPQTQQIPQYGLRNTVDLGQKSAADPSLADGEDRGQRSMSAPPESNHPTPTMSAPPQQEHTEQPPPTQSKVRTIPIFVEGRDRPVINETHENSPQFAESKPFPQPQHHPQHHPQQHHPQQHHPQAPSDPYFADDGPIYHQAPNFSRAFGTPFGKNYRQNQPFAHQKVYPQSAAFNRGASPGRSQSPKPQPHEEIKIPVHHEKPQNRQEPPRAPPKPQQPQNHQQAPPQQPPQPPKPQTPPPQPAKQQIQPPDPITQILAIQTDVLNLMTEVEKFSGNKKDKRYLYLDEMLTRNLIKLDTIETEGKENIRNARKEAIRCIQKCIAVLEAKADGRNLNSQPQETPQSPNDVEMNSDSQQADEKAVENGEEEMKETPKEEAKPEGNEQKNEENQNNEQKSEAPTEENKETAPQVADTRPEATAEEAKAEKSEEPKPENVDKPKKATKVTKRDKSKDKTEKKSEKCNKSGNKTENNEAMQIDDKGDKEAQKMEVDGASSQ